MLDAGAGSVDNGMLIALDIPFPSTTILSYIIIIIRPTLHCLNLSGLGYSCLLADNPTATCPSSGGKAYLSGGVTRIAPGVVETQLCAQPSHRFPSHPDE